MKPANRFFTLSVTVVTTAAIGFASNVAAPRPAKPPPRAIELTALSLPTTTPNDPLSLVAGWVERVVIPPSASQPLPTPQFLPIVAPNSIGSSIKNIYNAVEPWVRYGFDLAAYAVGWVPYVGWLAPQITIFYNFGERIARSITYNIADLLDGRVSFVQGLINVGVDTFNSFVQLGIDQLTFWLPPLPPLPPFPLAVNQQAPLAPPQIALSSSSSALATGATTPSVAPRDSANVNGQVLAAASSDSVGSPMTAVASLGKISGNLSLHVDGDTSAPASGPGRGADLALGHPLAPHNPAVTPDGITPVLQESDGDSTAGTPSSTTRPRTGLTSAAGPPPGQVSQTRSSLRVNSDSNHHRADATKRQSSNRGK